MSYTKVKGYTDKQLLDRVKKLSNFKIIPEGYWILGVRSQADTPNIYDDKFYLFNGEKFILWTTGTTNPGETILKGGWRNLNSDGAFVIKSDYWHYNLWQYGLHNGKIPALRQTGSQVVGYRDGNNNSKAEEVGKEVKGWFGINFHFNSYNIVEKGLWTTLRGVVSWVINGWSAGCQVANNAEDYKKIIDLCKNQKFVTYCLLKEF
jgi:hypothetical protein